FAPSGTVRGSEVRVIVPNAAELRLPFGAAKFARSNRLNASTRTSSRAAVGDAPNGIDLLAAASTCQKPGPRTVLRPALPNGWLESVGIATQSLLNQFAIDCVPDAAYGSHVTFGRSLFAPRKCCAMPDTTKLA